MSSFSLPRHINWWGIHVQRKPNSSICERNNIHGKVEISRSKHKFQNKIVNSSGICRSSYLCAVTQFIFKPLGGFQHVTSVFLGPYNASERYEGAKVQMHRIRTPLKIFWSRLTCVIASWFHLGVADVFPRFPRCKWVMILCLRTPKLWIIDSISWLEISFVRYDTLNIFNKTPHLNFDQFYCLFDFLLCQNEYETHEIPNVGNKIACWTESIIKAMDECWDHC